MNDNGMNSNEMRAKLGPRFAAMAVTTLALFWFVSLLLMRLKVIDVKRWDTLPVVPWMVWATAPWTCLAGAGILAGIYLQSGKKDKAFTLGGIVFGLCPMLMIYVFWAIAR
jgi:hypothetical protein